MSDIDPTAEPEANADNLAELRSAAERGKAATERADAAERKLAFIEAGITANEGPGKLLFDNYKGEATKDAVLAAAAGYGITPAAEQAPPEPPEPEYTSEERDQTRERANLAAGSEVPGGTPDPDPVAAGYAEFHELRTTGVPLEDAQDAVVGRILEAAYANRDPRVLHNQAEYLAENRGSARPR